MGQQKQTSVLFLFGRDIRTLIDEIQAGARPVAHCYWVFKLAREYPNIHYLGGKPRRIWLDFVWGLIRRLVYKYSGMGFNLDVALANRKDINDANIVFCTTDSIALPVLALKKLGMIQSKVFYQTIGLWDSWSRRKNELMRRLWSSLSAQADKILCFTPEEARRFSDTFNVSSGKMIQIHTLAGFDTKFFRGRIVSDGDYVLSIGRDRHRDFDTFVQAAALSGLRAIMVRSTENTYTSPLPPNLIEYVNIPYTQVMELYDSARIVVVTLHNNTYTAGWAVLGEAMSLGKPIIVTHVDALNGMDDILASGKNCLIVPIYDASVLSKSMIRLYNDGALRNYLGVNARATAEQFSDRYCRIIGDLLSS